MNNVVDNFTVIKTRLDRQNTESGNECNGRMGEKESKGRCIELFISCPIEEGEWQLLM